MLLQEWRGASKSCEINIFSAIFSNISANVLFAFYLGIQLSIEHWVISLVLVMTTQYLVS